MQNHPKSLRLYLVEDSPIILALLRDLVGEDSAMAVVGQSAEAELAIREIAELEPDVVLLDIALQHGTGFDVLKALPPTSARRPVILILSNFVSQRYRDEARRLGADGFFDKSQEIVALLKVLVSMAKAEGQNAPR